MMRLCNQLYQFVCRESTNIFWIRARCFIMQVTITHSYTDFVSWFAKFVLPAQSYQLSLTHRDQRWMTASGPTIFVAHATICVCVKIFLHYCCIFKMHSSQLMQSLVFHRCIPIVEYGFVASKLVKRFVKVYMYHTALLYLLNTYSCSL